MFYMSLLEQDTIRIKRVERILELDVGNNDNEECKVEAIWDSAVYANKLKLGYLPSPYY